MKRVITILGIIASCSLFLPAVSLAGCGAGDGTSGHSGDGGVGFNSLGGASAGGSVGEDGAGFGGTEDQESFNRGKKG